MKKPHTESRGPANDPLASTPLSKATLVHVARLAGVGLGTASRALGDGKHIRQETVSRVREAAKRLGYRRNEIARNLKVRRSEAVGIVVPDIGGEFMASCVKAAEAVIRENKYISVISFTDDDPDTEIAQIDYLVGRQIDGILLVPSAQGQGKNKERETLSGIPVVTFDQPCQDADAVSVSNQASAERAVRHLVEHGHKRIAYVGVNRDVPTLKARLKGYRKAIRSAGLTEFVSLLAADGEGAAQVLDEWTAMKQAPTALFSANELTSLKFLPELALRGIKVPEQLAILAFDDVQLGLFLRSPLSVMRQPAVEIGRMAAMLLMQRLRKEYEGEPRRVVLDAELVLRQSCGCNQ